jgi:hypothetical protein
VTMRDIKRIRKFCNQLADIWEMYPDLRFCQLLICSSLFRGRDPFYIEDEEAIQIIKNNMNGVTTSEK